MSDTERLRRKLIETRAALRAMADAYARRIRSDCSTPEELSKEPWRCAEYVEAERVLKLELKFDNEWLRRAIERDPDDVCIEAGILHPEAPK